MVAIATASCDRFPSRPTRPVLVVLPPVTRAGARTYRRRRLAVLCTALVLVTLVGLVATRGSTAPEVQTAPGSAPVVRDPGAYGAAGQTPPARSVYVVQPGDTVWSIAHQLDPTGDPRAVVDRIISLNGGAALQPGQRLRLNGE